jgi:predicted amidohydrolase
MDPTTAVAGIQEHLEEKGLVSLDVLVFPECALTGFAPLSAEQLSSRENLLDFEQTFRSISREIDSAVIAGAFVKNGETIHNSAVMFDPNAEKTESYFKRNLFRMSDESAVVTPGDTSALFAINGWNISPKICYDLRFPVDFYEQTPSTDLFAVIANWPDVRNHAWLSLLRARAIETEAFVLGVNRFGSDEFGHSYSTKPILFDPLGVEVLSVIEFGNVVIWQLPSRSTYKTVGSTKR